MRGNPIVDQYPLTPGQEERLARVLAGADEGAAHLELEVAGAETEALAAALGALAARHAALRTTFAWEAMPAPVQRVHEHGALPVEHADLAGAAPAEVAARVAAFVTAAPGVDPARPRTRVALFRTGEAVHRLVWSWHPLVLDARSALVLTRDALGALGGGAPPPPRDLREVLAWTGPREPAAAADAWRARRAEAAAAGAAGGPAPGARSRREACLPPAAVAELRAMARRHGLGPDTVARGAWALVLAGRLAAEAEVAFGACVAGLPPGVDGAEEIVGPLAALVPLRIRVPPDEAAWRWLDRMQTGRDSPSAHPPAPAGARPASALAVETAPPRVPGFTVRVVGGGEPPAAPLTATVLPAEGWRLRVEGPAGEAEALLARLGAVLEAVARSPERRLREVAARAAGEPAEPARRAPAPRAPEDDGAPLTPTEQVVAGAWTEVLGTTRVRRGDNFFDLGGDSLLLIRVFSRLQERIGPHVQMPDLFQHRTLAALARHLDAPPAPEPERAALDRAGARRAFTARAGAARAAALPRTPADDE